MTQRSNSVQSEPIVSDDRIRDMLRKEYNRAVNVARSTTRVQLASDSGVSIHQIDALMSRDASKNRRVTASDCLSLCWALGEHAVASFMALINYSARPMDDGDEACPMQMTATAMAHLSTIASAAADGRIDHTEAPKVREAADMLIATILPVSSHGDVA